MGTFSGTTKIAGDVIFASDHNTERKDVVQNAGDHATSGGSSNAYTLTVDSQFALTAGAKVKFKANFACTGATTLNVNSGGAVAMKIFGALDTVANDILNNQEVECIYDGSVWQILGPGGNGRLPYIPKVFTFGENINGTTTPQAVYLKASDSKVYKTVDSATESTYKFIGFTKENITTNNTGTVIIEGIVDGFPGASFTTGDEQFLNGTGTISTSPGTKSYKVARAVGTTSILIEKGPKIYVAGSSFNTTGAANNDLTLDLGFRAKKIHIKYSLQGHGAATGSAKYEKLAECATWQGTSLIGKQTFGSLATNSGDNAGFTTTDPLSIPQNTYNNTTDPSAGTASGTGAIAITLSVNSITDTTVVLRRLTQHSGSPSTARCDMLIEIEG